MKILLIIILILFNTSLALGQRCGDHFWLYIKDSNNKPINPAQYRSIKATTKYITNDSSIAQTDVTPEIIKFNNSIDIFDVRTICGLAELKFQLTYQDKLMEITIKNIPGDAGNFILKDLVFKPGKFEVDIGGRPINNCEMVHDTILDGNQIVEERLWAIKNSAIIYKPK